MNPEADKLYQLLPAIYRIRDAEQGSALRALCEVLAEDIAVLRENLDQLYDDQFIETCADWVAPYIGDVIGYRTLHAVTERTRSARAEVANTIAYRRRKGSRFKSIQFICYFKSDKYGTEILLFEKW